MSLWAIIPVKPLWKGKSRLAGVLTLEERRKLNQSLLEHTLAELRDVPEITQTLVISGDLNALALARQYGARTVQEDGVPALNSAIKRATLFAMNFATQGVLILPADIPLLNKQDIQTIIGLGNDPPVAVIVPDRKSDGTNALLTCPAGLIDYSYGPGSFKQHCDRAIAAGFHLHILNIDNVSLDLDTPEDLELLRKLEVIRKIDLPLAEEK